MAPMKKDEIDEILMRTLDDLRLSRSERQVLTSLLAEQRDEPDLLAYFRHRAFEMARRQLPGSTSDKVLTWLEEVSKALARAQGPDEVPSLAEAHFSPGDRCRRRISALLDQSRRGVDICVFTITDDHISRAILRAHKRGVRVRIISDDDKAQDRGSDVQELERAGLEVRLDRSEAHMHHKFAIFDGSFLVTGSYNWTRSAATSNEENLVVSNDPRLIGSFGQVFDKLWSAFAP
jgi:mitochondrial cardiolipin hydrolase